MTRTTTPAPASQSLALDLFHEPPKSFLPAPFWSWNEDIQPDEAKRQMTELADAGLNGGFIHPRVGLTTPYLGDAWFKAVDASIEAAQANGVNVWLYDEDKWPSGYSGGTVPLAHEDYRLQALFAAPGDAPVLEGSVRVCDIPGGAAIYKWTSPLGDPWFNGTCYGQLLSSKAMRKFLDDAYEPYYQRYAEHFGKLIPAMFTDEPCAIFRNRLPGGAVPYGAELVERFTQMHSYDPTPRMHLLFVDGPGAERFRLHYYRTVNDLFENNFSKQLGDWCVAHGVDLTGHYMAEEGLYSQQTWGVKIMPNYRHEGIPGIDHLGRQIYERVTAKQCQSVVNQFGKKRMLSELYGTAGAALSFEDRWWIGCQQIALGVNLLNHHLTLYTMAGCRKRDYPQNMFYQQPWWSHNAAIDKPLGRLCYALSCGRYHAEMLVLHPQESVFALWKGRVQSAEAAAKLSFWDWDPTPDDTKQAVMAMEQNFLAVIDTLLGAQRTFDLADETILEQDGDVIVGDDGRPMIQVGEATYPMLVLPSVTTIRPSTMRTIQQFIEMGGPVLSVGDLPRWLDGEPSDELDALMRRIPRTDVAQLTDRIDAATTPAIALSTDSPAKALTFSHIRTLPDDTRLVLLTNLHRTASIDHARLQLAGPWRCVDRLDPWTGQTHNLPAHLTDDGLDLTITLAPTETLLLRLGTSDTSEQHAAASRAPHHTIDLPAVQWRAERLDDNAITLDMAAWCESDGAWSVKPAPVIAIQQRLNDLKYDGPLTLSYPVRVDSLDPNRKVHLVVEHPEWYTIRVNGRAVRYEGLPFWRDIRWSPINVTGLLQPGDNIIELANDAFRYGDLASIHDSHRRYGTEIESIYLVGDFDVHAEPTGEHPLQPGWIEQFALPPVHTDRLKASSLALTNPTLLRFGDTTTQGLPFYAGRLSLSTKLPRVTLDNHQRLILCLETLDAAVADVRLGNRPAGQFITHPFEVDLTDAYLAGEDELTIELFSTLRNLLGPHHHPDGERNRVYPSHFTPDADTPFETVVSAWPEKLERWLTGTYQPPQWNDDYCVVSFGRIGNVQLDVRHTKGA